MPRILSPPTERNNSLLYCEIKKSMIDRGIDNNRELAQRLGVSPPTLIAKLKDPERLTLVDIRRLDRTVGLSEQAVKAMLGRA